MSSLSLAFFTRSGVNKLTRPICTSPRTVSFRVQVRCYCWRVDGFEFSPTSSSFPQIQAVSGGTSALLKAFSSANVGKPFGNCFSTISIFAVDCTGQSQNSQSQSNFSRRTGENGRRNTESKQQISEIHSAINPSVVE
jgi:hypothetical protein